ncbi:TPA: hypothetical protein EYP13_03870 [Candidatus Micrarchaeota archaeon]|nr:hypothetical protein [Candidatus Micrarchaeota archaeon]
MWLPRRKRVSWAEIEKLLDDLAEKEANNAYELVDKGVWDLAKYDEHIESYSDGLRAGALAVLNYLGYDVY